MTAKPTLLFVSPQFLLPMDAGGKIRSANLLKHLRGGAFRTLLLTPASAADEARWKVEIAGLADETESWRGPQKIVRSARRIGGFAGATPISAIADATAGAKRAIADALARRPDLVVFDYVQSLAMAPREIGAPQIIFAHNVETEILERHAALARDPMKSIWLREAAKMRRFEQGAITRADAVITVSGRDAQIMRRAYGAKRVYSIPTGVDADHFAYGPPESDAPPRVVFTGSLDWKANEDGLSWFMSEVWPHIAAARPDAEFVIVGKHPPRALVGAAKARGFNWRFTGFVDDIRDHARGAAFVIPLRVGGGTRIKAFEAMAIGVPVVSTALGVEGLPVTANEHFLQADDPRLFADLVLRLLADSDLRARLSRRARRLIEQNFSHQQAARTFERHCLAVITGSR